MMPSEKNDTAGSALLVALTDVLRDARDAIASQNLGRLETAVLRQQELVSAIALNAANVQRSSTENSKLVIDFVKESAVLRRVMRRCDHTIRALAAIVADREPLYSLESLPRR